MIDRDGSFWKMSKDLRRVKCWTCSRRPYKGVATLSNSTYYHRPNLAYPIIECGFILFVKSRCALQTFRIPYLPSHRVKQQCVRRKASQNIWTTTIHPIPCCPSYKKTLKVDLPIEHHYMFPTGSWRSRGPRNSILSDPRTLLRTASPLRTDEFTTLPVEVCIAPTKSQITSTIVRQTAPRTTRLSLSSGMENLGASPPEKSPTFWIFPSGFPFHQTWPSNANTSTLRMQ